MLVSSLMVETCKLVSGLPLFCPSYDTDVDTDMYTGMQPEMHSGVREILSGSFLDVMAHVGWALAQDFLGYS